MSNLQAAPTGTQNIDAISKIGDRYSVKSTTGNFDRCIFMDLNLLTLKLQTNKNLNFLLIVKFDNDYQLEKIIQLDWNLFIKYRRWHKTMTAWNITITKALTEEADILFEKEIEKSYDISEIRKKHKKSIPTLDN